MAPWNRRFLLDTITFRFHVKLGECIFYFHPDPNGRILQLLLPPGRCLCDALAQHPHEIQRFLDLLQAGKMASPVDFLGAKNDHLHL